ncbi:hypothetical protein ACQPUZ_18685 [Clostridium tertium]
MGLNKFLEDDTDKIVITKKDYKNKVNQEVKTKFEEETNENSINLLDMGTEVKSEKKIAMSIYFKEDDLKLLKAISRFKNTTVNKTVMSILESPLDATRCNLPDDFNIEKLAKEYDKNSRNKKTKSK